MFTLSDKQRVLNTDADVKFFDAANAAVATSAAVALTDRVHIEGFGTFNLSDFTYIKMRRAVAPVADAHEYTVVAPTGIAIGDAVEVVISLSTSRYQAEVLAQNGIGNGRTFKFSTGVLTAVAATDIRDAIVAGFATWTQLFAIGSPLVTVANGIAATDILVTGDAAGSIGIERVEIRRIQQGIPTQSYVTLTEVVTANTAEGFEGMGQGKFLEESIQMATPYNTDPYGLDTNDTRVDVRGAYTEIIFNVSAEYLENLGTTAADFGHTNGVGGPAYSGVAANHSFALYLNEASCLAANGAIDKLAAATVLLAGALADVDVNVLPAPLSAADERVEGLIIADGSSVATNAAFIA